MMTETDVTVFTVVICLLIIFLLNIIVYVKKTKNFKVREGEETKISRERDRDTVEIDAKFNKGLGKDTESLKERLRNFLNNWNILLNYLQNASSDEYFKYKKIYTILLEFYIRNLPKINQLLTDEEIKDLKKVMIECENILNKLLERL